METLLVKRLINDTSIGDLVGTRVYPLVLPQEPTYPALDYRRVSSVEYHSHAQAGGMTESRVQIDCLSSTYGQALDLAGAVRRVLDGWEDYPDGILACLLANELEIYEDITETYRRILDFMIKWR